MSYTNVDILRTYLVDTFPNFDRIFDQEAVLTGVEEVSFYGGAVDATSLKVKSIHSNIPDRIVMTLLSGPTSFHSLPVVSGSVVVASDSSLGTVYTENIDYIVDYATANLLIKPGGSLSVDQQVTVWFQTYHLYASPGDYIADTDRGTIRRSAGSDIADGETVRLDYQPLARPYNDDIISAAVIMANGLVEKEIDPTGTFGADPTLQAVATFRALEIICQSSAVRDLSVQSDRQAAVSSWLKLAESFSHRVDNLLKSFRPPFESPSVPTHG